VLAALQIRVRPVPPWTQGGAGLGYSPASRQRPMTKALKKRLNTRLIATIEPVGAVHSGAKAGLEASYGVLVLVRLTTPKVE